MGVSIKQLYGTKTLEEKAKEDEFWAEWCMSRFPRVYNDRGGWDDLSLSIDEAILLFIGDEVTTKDIPKLRKIALEDGNLTDEDKAFVTGLIQAVEADALQATDGGKPVEVPTASPEEAQPAPRRHSQPRPRYRHCRHALPSWRMRTSIYVPTSDSRRRVNSNVEGWD